MNKAFNKQISLLFLMLMFCVLGVYPANASVLACGRSSNIRVNKNLDGEHTIPLPIIMYHSTCKSRANKYSVTVQQLEADFKYIKQNGFEPIFMQDLINFTEGTTALPARPIMLTFDDAYSNNYYSAFPIIKKHGIKTVFSVVGRYTDNNYKNDQLHETFSHMTYEQIKEMAESGLVEFQNHTYDLHKAANGRVGLSKRQSETEEQYKAVVTNDLTKLNSRLYEKTGINCTAVTFPYGKYSKETNAIIKDLGFKATLSCTEGINYITPQSSLFGLKRYNRPSGINSLQFFKRFKQFYNY